MENMFSSLANQIAIFTWLILNQSTSDKVLKCLPNETIDLRKGNTKSRNDKNNDIF